MSTVTGEIRNKKSRIWRFLNEHLSHDGLTVVHQRLSPRYLNEEIVKLTALQSSLRGYAYQLTMEYATLKEPLKFESCAASKLKTHYFGNDFRFISLIESQLSSFELTQKSIFRPEGQALIFSLAICEMLLKTGIKIGASNIPPILGEQLRILERYSNKSEDSLAGSLPFIIENYLASFIKDGSEFTMFEQHQAHLDGLDTAGQLYPGYHPRHNYEFSYCFQSNCDRYNALHGEIDLVLVNDQKGDNIREFKCKVKGIDKNDVLQLIIYGIIYRLITSRKISKLSIDHLLHEDVREIPFSTTISKVFPNHNLKSILEQFSALDWQ